MQRSCIQITYFQVSVLKHVQGSKTKDLIYTHFSATPFLLELSDQQKFYFHKDQ